MLSLICLKKNVQLVEVVELLNQIKNGFKYKYPLCCILWFVTSYHNMRIKGQLFSIVGKRNINEWDAVNNRIMCPDCLIEVLSK